MDYDPAAIEEQWRTRWAEEGRYEADPAEAASTFVTVPYPYPSGGMHVGHARTYTVPDVYARYRRLRGDNVLFPIAWHVTGTPIVGAVERLKSGEREQLQTLQDAFGVPESDLRDLETPMGYARYFIEEADSSYKRGMRKLGLSIDWRREFTTQDERYSKFVTWQYETLRERGLLEKGLHPVNYCTNERQPVTTHDLLEGEEAEFQEFTLIRFRLAEGEGDGGGDGVGDGNRGGDGGSDADGGGSGGDGGDDGPAADGDDGEDDRPVVPMATLRPETVRGVTNAFVHPDGTYVRATVDGEEWVVSDEAAEKFDLQDRDVAVRETMTGEALVGERVENPVTGETVVVLPATFVDPDNATGVVMSVPAHSPDDYVALEEAKADAERIEREYGVDAGVVRAIEPVPILTIEGYGEVPARDAVESAGIESTDDPGLHAVTEDLYGEEFRRGRLLETYGEFAGEVVEEVRDRFREHHRAAGAFDAMYEFTEEVVCRCGGDVEVAEQETWFLRYGDEAWKAKARRAVDRLAAIPESTREQYYDTIDWLEEWPCIRNYGLGTRLPWDEEFVIEPLSDSTIYMAYYTVAPHLREVPVEDLDRSFFDALFYGADGEHAPEGVDVDVADPDPRALEIREEWDYWYPVDFRCSANDLIRNHLTFFLFHHAELFPEDKWPGGITVMGMGLLEGESMSSSKGHVRLPGEVIERYGADTVRFFLLNSAEPWQDFDWRAEQVGSTRDQLGRFWNQARAVIDRPVPEDAREELAPIDRWLLSKLQATIREATDAMDRFETRSASQTAFYRFEEHLRWYRRRTDTDRPGARWTLREVLSVRLRLLAPFVPFMANELFEALSGEPADDADWPKPDPALDSPDREVEESLVADLFEDVADIVDVTGADPDVVRVYVAAGWKRRAFEAVAEHAGGSTDPDVGAVMGTAMEEPALRERGDDVADLVAELVEFARGRPEEELATLTAVDERAVYESAASFLGREFDADVEVYVEDDPDVHDPEDKAGRAVPFRPAVYLE